MRTICILSVILTIFGLVGERDYEDEKSYWQAFCEKNPLPEQCKEWE